jgi:hypothetical protein
MGNKKLTRRQKTYLTLSGILMAIGAFIGLMMAMALVFYLLEPLILRR